MITERSRSPCTAWITTTFDAVTTLLLPIIVTLESVLGLILNGIGTLLTLCFSIPIIGMLLYVLCGFLHHFVSGLFVLPAIVLHLCHILPEKRLRLRIVIQRDENGKPICEHAEVLSQLQMAIDIFKTSANIRIIPIGPFVYALPFQCFPQASDGYICIESSNSTSPLLNCKGGPFSPRGWARMAFNAKMCRFCFWANWRRLLGYGAPICVFAVRRIEGGNLGMAGRLIADFALVDFTYHRNGIRFLNTLAHEMCHLCLLRHSEENNNLMNPLLRSIDPQNCLTSEQVFRLRKSPHVTYL